MKESVFLKIGIYRFTLTGFRCFLYVGINRYCFRPSSQEMPTTSTSSSEPRVPPRDSTSATGRTTKCRPSSVRPERSGEKARLGAELGAVDRAGCNVFLMPTSALSFVTNTTTFSSLGPSSVGPVQWLSSSWPFFFQTFYFLLAYGFPWWLGGKESAYSAGDLGSVSGLGRSPGKGNGNPLQYFHLENSMDRGAWWATVHRVAKSQRRASDKC